MTGAAPALLADIGGTNARFALLRDGRIEDIGRLATADYPNLADAAAAYLAGRGIGAAAIAVAGPVGEDRIHLTNCGWSFTRDELAAAFDTANVQVVNDFTAQALALPHYGKTDLRKIGPGRSVAAAPRAVLGPGTGLGVSGVVPCVGTGATGTRWVPLATEGGHVTLPAATREETAVVDRLRDRFGHVSAERVLSGPGLLHLLSALADISGIPAPYETSDQITAAARDGSDPQAARAVSMFCDFLGTVAGDLALSLGATGGVYIAGGIVPQLGDGFARSGFRARFEAKGRFVGYMRAIPTWVVTADYPAFIGLKALIEETV